MDIEAELEQCEHELELARGHLYDTGCVNWNELTPAQVTVANTIVELNARRAHLVAVRDTMLSV